MDPRFNPGSSSHSHYPVLSPNRRIEQDDSQVDYIQNSGLEEIQNIGGLSWHPSHLPVRYGKLYCLKCVWP